MKKKYTKEQLIIACVTSVCVGIILMTIFVQLELSPQWVTDQTCNKLTSISYNQGIINVANYTTITGNFTYIYNNSIQTQNVLDYCTQVNQNLNTQ